ncbi:MAG: Uma2 family endonuclease [Desertifilum sp.]|nr:Uma2 family endonuclease [Oscillatoria laete-virens]MCD8489771.1 Uma2 family endonuclease [Desertifilum sp.]MDI9641733.1 Uma2 family endonuclease [Geitlerinema splendidum]MDL5052148.1 Uma2 family endonuclease [Oscillatoria laete-virens NRMC-F 0139]
MLSVPSEVGSSPLVLHLQPIVNLTDDQFFEFCQLNRNLRIELTATGEILIMPPTGSETGERNFNLIGQLWVWVNQDRTGIGFDSSTGFQLPNGAKVSPDAAWVRLERWNALTCEQQQKFAPLCPDFIVELRSPSDNLEPLKTKMQEYLDNGMRLGWLIDRKNRQVYLYRLGRAVECLDNPATLSGEEVLLGFILDLSQIW